MIIIMSKRRTTTNRTGRMTIRTKMVIVILIKSNKAQMEKTTTKIQTNNFRKMTIHDTSLKTFRLNSTHRASRHFKKKFKSTPKDC